MRRLGLLMIAPPASLARLVLLAPLAWVGCSPAHRGDDAFWESASEQPSAQEEDAGTQLDTAAPTGTCLELTFVTSAPGGKYQPANVGAVWVVSSTGEYLRTLALWGSKRAHHLTRWGDASGFDLVDAVTQATRKSHGPMVIDWDCNDRTRTPVARGTYSIMVEMTDANSGSSGAAPTVVSMFSLVHDGGAPTTLTLPDDPFFSSRTLRYTP